MDPEERLASFVYELDKIRRKFGLHEIEEIMYRAEPYRPALQVMITKEYTHPSAWAHTRPEEKSVCIRPVEFLDYRNGITFESVMGHEIGHNIKHAYGLPDNNEDEHTANAYRNLNSGKFGYTLH